MKKSENILNGIRESAGVVLMLVLMVSVVAGCGRSKPSQFYTLRAVIPESVTGESITKNKGESIVVGVGSISVPGYIDRNKIVTRIDDAEVKLSEYSRWAEPAADKIESIIEENLVKLCQSAEVSKYIYSSHTDFTHYIQVNIDDFIADSNGAAFLVARYVIFKIGDDSSTIRRAVNYKKVIKPDDYSGIVSAMSSLLGDLCVDIAKDL